MSWPILLAGVAVGLSVMSEVRFSLRLLVVRALIDTLVCNMTLSIISWLMVISGGTTIGLATNTLIHLVYRSIIRRHLLSWMIVQQCRLRLWALNRLVHLGEIWWLIGSWSWLLSGARSGAWCKALIIMSISLILRRHLLRELPFHLIQFLLLILESRLQICNKLHLVLVDVGRLRIVQFQPLLLDEALNFLDFLLLLVDLLLVALIHL